MHKTEVINDELDPVWDDETFELRISPLEGDHPGGLSLGPVVVNRQHPNR